MKGNIRCSVGFILSLFIGLFDLSFDFFFGPSMLLLLLFAGSCPVRRPLMGGVRKECKI